MLSAFDLLPTEVERAPRWQVKALTIINSYRIIPRELLEVKLVGSY
jgi:hypothetical protein